MLPVKVPRLTRPITELFAPALKILDNHNSRYAREGGATVDAMSKRGKDKWCWWGFT